MNDRTKDVNPNVYSAWQQAAATVSPLKTGGEWQKDFVIKFAELILKECCNVVDYDNARAITNHFGNKEDPPVEKSRDLMKGLWKV